MFRRLPTLRTFPSSTVTTARSIELSRAMSAQSSANSPSKGHSKNHLNGPPNNPSKGPSNPKSTSNTGAYTAATYQRNPSHVANTSHPSSETSYILTLLTSQPHHAYLTSLRTKYFPPHLNKLSAHIALFRALPGSQLPRITRDLADLTSRHRPFPIIADRPFRLRHGIGINVQRSEAEELYAELKERWGDFLSQQDRSFRAHYTVQNKVDDEQRVSGDLEELRGSFRRCEGTVEGVVLWRYERGYWRDGREFRFGE